MDLTVVIVDDDPMVSLMHRTVIRKGELSSNIQNFANGKDALDFLVSSQEGYSYLLLLDLNMPVMNGWEFLDELNKHDVGKNVIVAIVSSTVDKSNVVRATDYPQVVDFLSKPFTKNNLNDLIRMNTILQPSDID
jgi:response regulator of citrate/malate metabolism